ncbi:fungal hydrophobin-domain-containing protein [Panaeolus papilionaceus]|nr:fungal hydrophobin-domain-containing protein [Panaeolus papilionaceus]
MFSKLAVLAAASMAVFVAAAPAAQGINNSCNTGSVQCCNQVMDSKSDSFTVLAALLGFSISDITGQVGMGCSPISVIGLGSGANCNAQPVCCSGNKFNGLINIGCSPITLNA